MDETTAPVPPRGPPPQVQVMQMIMAGTPSRVLCAYAELGIADVVGDEAKTASDVATTIRAYEP